MESSTSLNQQLSSAKKELILLRFKNKSGQLKETNLIRKTRKHIARLSTKMHSDKAKKNV